MPLGQRLAQMLRVGKARRPKRASSYSSRRSSIAQSLPDELILAILTHLSHDGLLGQHTYPISHIVEPSRAARAREAALCQQGLYAATLSCRSWYPVGIELLYSSPIILTKRKIELLLRTLTAFPHLADYVNDLYAPLIASKSPLAWLQNTLSIKSTSADTDDGAHLVTRLARTTSVLNALSLKHVVPSGHISTVPLFSLSHAFPAGLEHLTIHGTSFESQDHPQFCLLPSHETNGSTSFDTLKTLCLRDMYILPTVKFPRMPHVERVALVQNHYFHSLTPVVNPDAPALLTADTFPSLRTLDIYGDDIPFASLARVADPSILYNLHAFTVVQALGHLPESLKLVSGAFDADSIAPSTTTTSTSSDSTTATPTNLRALTIGVIGTMDTSALEKWHIPPTIERLTLLLSCGQPAYTRAEVNTLRRSQSLSPSLSRSRSHNPPQSYDPGEGRQLVRSVFKCLEHNLRRNHSRSSSGSGSGSGSLCLRELCLVVGPGVLSAPGDAEKVQSLCREGKTGLSVVYQDPDSRVAEMLVGMEARSTSTQTRLARIRSSDTATAKFVDVQHLDHYTPQELAV